MNEFFKVYYENMIRAIENHDLKVEDIEFKCEYCPIREKCRKASENDDTRTCGQFIEDHMANK